ncbi:MAG: glycosyltransferase family 2 protein [Candidatus Kapaibacterium sp.]
MPELSIITINYNGGGIIRETIESVISQTYRDFEYIVIDGGSTDVSREIIEEYRVKIDKFVSEPDEGVFDAQNKGIKMAEGNYLLFVNGGDRLLKEKSLEEFMSFEFDEAIVYGDMLVKLPNGFTMRREYPGKIKKHYMFSDTIPHQAALIKRSLFGKTGLFDLRYPITADYHFFLKIIYELKLPYRHISYPLSVFDFSGVSSRPEMRPEHDRQKFEAFKEVIGEKEAFKLQKIRPLIWIFTKYPRYSVYLLKSLISKKYLGKD